MKNNEKAEIDSGLQGFMCYNVIAKSVISRVYVQFQYNQKSIISIKFKLLGENHKPFGLIKNARVFVQTLIMDKIEKKCVPCESGISVLSQEIVNLKLGALEGWSQLDKKIEKMFKFMNFKDALVFVNNVGGIAESENHHPDIYLTYGKVKISIWTHAINGLSENDFILAEKIDEINY